MFFLFFVKIHNFCKKIKNFIIFTKKLYFSHKYVKKTQKKHENASGNATCLVFLGQSGGVKNSQKGNPVGAAGS